MSISLRNELTGGSQKNPIIVGLYGIPGSGKTTFLNQLKQKFKEEHVALYEGSKMIASLVPGGLEAFQKLDEQEKVRLRQKAIETIKGECSFSGCMAIVAGHFMFWDNESDDSGKPVYTQNDLSTYTHILYLDVPAEEISRRRLEDTQRNRPRLSVDHLHKWQQAEITLLRRLCRDHGILFSILPPHLALTAKVTDLLNDFQFHSEEVNLARASNKLDEILDTSSGQLETVLVLDADKTLAAEDSGKLFWKSASESFPCSDDHYQYPLKALFSSSLGYSYTAFRQAVLLNEEAMSDEIFNSLCERVASEISLYPEFVVFLKRVTECQHLKAVIVTCGLRLVWEKVLKKAGLSKFASVIGGGRIADGFVVTPEVKGFLVTRLQDIHQLYVWAFGDSPLDLHMLKRANQAVVVVGEDQTRSRSMDGALKEAIDHDGLRARQVLLPSTVSPRLDHTRLPVVRLTEDNVVGSIRRRRGQLAALQVLHATDENGAKLLKTPMRDAANAGPTLRSAHRHVGHYLATGMLAEHIGVEAYSIPHVQGHSTDGYRLLHEKQTLIVALMRAGEPIAYGINDVFPLAGFLHASRPDDIKAYHMQGLVNILLVDAVINSGETILQFVDHIRQGLRAAVRIVVVTEVVQEQAIGSRSRFADKLTGYDDISIVALRLSGNKFTGRGGTDTGNRLFNTTHLP